MSVRPLIAAIALVAAGSAFAQEATNDGFDAVRGVTQESRAEVRADLVQARAPGELRAYSTGYLPSVSKTSSLTRAEVRAETLAARNSGELDAIDAPVYGYVPVTAHHYAADQTGANTKVAAAR